MQEKTALSDQLKRPLSDLEQERYVLHRRFDRMGRLVGDTMMEKLFSTHVMIIGLGGVGSWTAESLARSGVGRITLVDFDEICITNTNRQLHALQGMVGEKKALVMAERLRRINPQGHFIGVDQFFEEKSSEEILDSKPDYVVDAIDNITAKCHLISIVKKRAGKIISSGGASGRLDPQKIQLVDMAESHSDPLLVHVRRILRANYNFPKEGSFGVPCVFSSEEPQEPRTLHYDRGRGFHCVCPQGKNDHHTCERRSVIYGNASFVTGSFGLSLASWVVRDLTLDT